MLKIKKWVFCTAGFALKLHFNYLNCVLSISVKSYHWNTLISEKMLDGIIII